MAIRQKTEVIMSLTAHGQSHSRTQVRSRDVFAVIDEPIERDGTNLGLSPTETLMAALMGCTNVISHKIARSMGVRFGEMTIGFTSKFDRRGVLLQEEVERPFNDIVMDIEVETDATPEQMEEIKTELAKFCPIAKVIRGSGVTITENWTTKSV